MSNILSRSLILSAATLAIGFAAQMSTAQAGSSNDCNLNVKTTGLHSCQCEVLMNHQAEWKVLMRLSSMDVCNSPNTGNGNADKVTVQQKRGGKIYCEKNGYPTMKYAKK